MKLRPQDKDTGQALTEFALIAPILFILLFGVLQLGLLFGSQNGLVDGVRNATRRAATYRVNDASFGDTTVVSAVCAAVKDELNSQLSAAIPGYDPLRLVRTVSYHWEENPGSDTSQDRYFLYVQVDAAYKHPLFVPLIGAFFDILDGTSDGAYKLSASEQMRVENPSLPLGSTPSPCA